MKNPKVTLGLITWMAGYGHLEETLKLIQNQKYSVLDWL